SARARRWIGRAARLVSCACAARSRGRRPHTRGPIPRMRWLLLFAIAAFLGTKDIATSYSDFSVSYFAAQELCQGTGRIDRGYEGREETFGYPPAALLPVLPLVATLPRTAVQVTFGIGQGLATVLLVKELLRIFGRVTVPRALLALLLLGRPLANALHN